MAFIAQARLQSEIAGLILFQRLSTLGCKSSWRQASPSLHPVSLIVSKYFFRRISSVQSWKDLRKAMLLGQEDYKARGSRLNFSDKSASKCIDNAKVHAR